MSFCTSCGSPLTGSQYCTTCGAAAASSAGSEGAPPIQGPAYGDTILAAVGQPGGSRQGGGGSGTPEFATARPMPPQTSPPPSDRRSRAPWFIALAVVLVAVLGFSSWFFVIRDSDPAATNAPKVAQGTNKNKDSAQDSEDDPANSGDSEENEDDAPAVSSTSQSSRVTITATAETESASTRSSSTSAPATASSSYADSTKTGSTARSTTATTTTTTTTSVAPGYGTYSPQTTVMREGSPLVVTPVTASISVSQGTFPVVNGEAVFTTATGNVICRLGPDSVECNVNPGGISYVAPPQPASCTGTWGYSAQIAAAGQTGNWSCSITPWAALTVPVLTYGTELTNGTLKCASQELGVTCLDTNGHGFRISRSDGATFY